MFRLVEQCFGSARYFGSSGGAAAKFTGPVAGLFPSGQTHKTGAGEYIGVFPRACVYAGRAGYLKKIEEISL